jgi:hypothetical protein
MRSYVLQLRGGGGGGRSRKKNLNFFRTNNTG